jgi:hypothetical protein
MLRKLSRHLFVLIAYAAPFTAIAATPLAGDVDGNGYTDVALWDPSQARALLDSTHDGHMDGITPPLGVSTDVPFMGDWDGDGVDTLALYRRSSNQVIWTNSNSNGTYSARSVANITAAQGIPVRGDWDGNGTDGFAIYDVSNRTFTFYQSMAGAAFASQDFGNNGDLPVSGDWNNDSSDGFGVYRPSTQEFWLCDTIGGAPSLHTASAGNPGDVPLSGKWPGQSQWSIGLYRPSTSQFWLYGTLSLSGLQSITWLDPSVVVRTNGRQSLYTGGVPHASVNGTERKIYSATDSFLLRGIFGIASATDEAGANMFEELANAGFNAALLWPHLSVAEALAAADGTEIRLIPRATEGIATYDSDPRIFGWYGCDEPSINCNDVCDEPTNDCNDLAALTALYAGYDQISTHFLFHTNTAHNTTNWPDYAALGDAGAVDTYPIRDARLDGSGIPIRDRGLTVSIESIADNMTALRAAVSENKPVWFVPQAFGSISRNNPWATPSTNPNQYRAMVYTAFVHGASGLLAFGRDGIAMRVGDNLGISPYPIDKYCPVGEQCHCFLANGDECEAARPTELGRSEQLWAAVASVNEELSALKPALLSPTSAATYTIDLLQTPNSGASPIRTLLKTSPNGTYLIAVNMINDNLDVVMQLTGLPSSVAVEFENRSIATPLSAIRDSFGPFAVHIYKY